MPSYQPNQLFEDRFVFGLEEHGVELIQGFEFSPDLILIQRIYCLW